MDCEIEFGGTRGLYNTRRPHSALGYRPPAPAAYGDHMAREAHDQSAARKLARSQVDRASRANLHRWCPRPSKIIENLPDRRSVNACSCGAMSGFPFRDSLHCRPFVQQIVDRLIRHLSSDSNCPAGTIASTTPKSGRSPSAIIEDEAHRRSFSIQHFCITSRNYVATTRCASTHQSTRTR